MTSLPTYVSTGTFTDTQVDATPGLPTGWAENDIFILVVETNGDPINALALNGWYELPVSYQQSGSTHRLTGFWKRAAASESAPTIIDPGDHCFAAISAFRGCAIRGKPWNKIAGGVDSSADTTRTAGGFTTTVDNCLVAIFQGDGRDVAGQTLSSWANTDLGSVTEQADTWSATGGGGGWGMATGTKVTAGTVGNTTATSTGSAASTWFTIALKPAGEEDALVYSGPTFVARGTADSRSTAGAIAPGLPSGWAEHDVFILMCEGDTSAPSAPSGWSAIPNSPVSISSLSVLSGFWKRASSSESAPSVTMPGSDHLSGQIIAIRGCHPEGDPWDVNTSSTDTTADNTGNLVGGTVLSDNVLVLTILGNGTDAATLQTYDWRPHDEATDAINYTLCADTWVATGGGGGVAVCAWEMLSAGSFAARQATLLTANTNVSILLGVKAGPGPVSSVQVIWIGG